MFRPEDWSQHVDALRRMARELLRDEHLADDLAQTAMLAALDRPPAVLSLEWLKTVLRNRSRDAARARTRRSDLELALREDPGSAPDVADVAQQLELHERLTALARQLREPYRTAVYLRYFEDLPPTEIARRIGVPVSTVKTRLQRGLAHLRTDVEREFGGDGRWQRALLPFALRVEPSGSAAPLTLALGAGLMLKIVGALAVGIVGWVLWESLGSPSVAPAPAVVAQTEDRAVADAVPPSEQAPPAARADASRNPATVVTSAAPTGGALRVRTTWYDGTPAPGIGVDLSVAIEGLPDWGVHRDSTDANGELLVDDLPAGTLLVRSDRGDEETAEVVAGETRTVVLAIEHGVAVVGEVVDAHGAPVPNAGLWLATGEGSWQGGNIIAHADKAGRFRLRDISPEHSIGALAPGLAPSSLVDLETLVTSASPVEVRLILDDPGGALSVRVLAEGREIVGARVAVGRPAPPRFQSGSWRENWTPVSRLTENGGYTLFGELAPGERSVEVRAEGFPAAQRTITVAAGETAELTVVLEPGARIHGTVRRADGTPAAGCLVRAIPEDFDDQFLQGGQFNYESTFRYPCTVADANGHYELEARPGRALVFASMPPTLWSSTPWVRTEFELSPGAEQRWDPQLAEPTLVGRVVYSDGAPMPYVFIDATELESSKSYSTTTNEDGAFAFYHLPNSAHALAVQLEDSPTRQRKLRMKEVWPGSGEVILEADYPEPRKSHDATVRVELSDPYERIADPKSASFQLARIDLVPQIAIFPTEREGTRAVFRNVAPGTRRLQVFAGGQPVYYGEPFELLPGQDLDLGVLSTEPAGRARFTVHLPEGYEPEKLNVALRSADSGGFGHVHDGGVVVADNLTPGAWRLLIAGEGLSYEAVSFDVRAGEVTEGEFVARIGVDRALEVLYPADQVPDELSLWIVENGERRPDAQVDPSPSQRGFPYRRTLRLPVGPVGVEIETDNGLVGALQLDVAEGSTDEPVRIELRPR